MKSNAYIFPIHLNGSMYFYALGKMKYFTTPLDLLVLKTP